MAFIAAGIPSTMHRAPCRLHGGNSIPRRIPRRSPARRRRVRATAANSGGSDAAEPASPPVDGLSAVFSALSSAADAVAEAAFAPVASCSVLSRQWESVGGNLILRPPGRARAVLHFIGGAFVGAAPHIGYRSLLERLARRGYCIVAAPFDISLDYLAVVAGIADAWERAETDLALEYGAVPVVGVGHSAGALFHVIMSALFADACPKAANILISFNNKPATDAIPLYQNVFAPAFAALAAAEQRLPKDFVDAVAAAPHTVEDALRGSPFLPKRVRENLIPTLQESRRILAQIAPLVREIGGVARDRADAESDVDADADADASGGRRSTGVPPEFYPPPEEVRAAAEMLYSAGQTLVVKFEKDSIDESAKVEAMVRARGAGPDEDAPAVTLVELPGTHITPLVQDVPRPVVSGAEAAVQGFWNSATSGSGANSAIVPVAAAVSAALQEVAEAAGGKDMHRLEELIDEWVQAGIANGYL